MARLSRCSIPSSLVPARNVQSDTFDAQPVHASFQISLQRTLPLAQQLPSAAAHQGSTSSSLLRPLGRFALQLVEEARTQQHVIAVIGQKASLPDQEVAGLRRTSRLDAHAKQGLMGATGETMTRPSSSNAMNPRSKRWSMLGRQQESTLAVQPFLVGCVPPWLAMARAQMLLAVDACNPACVLENTSFGRALATNDRSPPEGGFTGAFCPVPCPSRWKSRPVFQARVARTAKRIQSASPAVRRGSFRCRAGVGCITGWTSPKTSCGLRRLD